MKYLNKLNSFAVSRGLQFLGAGLFLLGSLLQASDDRPNFIFILTDDQSAGYMGFEGNMQIQTPYMDRLASEGVGFDRAYVTSAICTPSRASIFLSQFERRHGINFNSGTSVAPGVLRSAYPEWHSVKRGYRGF